jgi:hypothetical protein
VIAWIHHRGKDWGRFLQREAAHAWPAVSLMHRIREEGSVGAAIKQHNQRIPVTFMPREVADFHRVVLTMEGSVRQVVEVVYRSNAGRDAKAEALGVSKSRMYQLLDIAHGYLSARLDVRGNDLSSLSNHERMACGK